MTDTTSSESRLQELLALSHQLGDAGRQGAILGKGTRRRSGSAKKRWG